MQDFLSTFPFRNVSIIAIIVGRFTYNVLLDRVVDCTCKDVDFDCWKYLLSPVFTISFLILWMDRKIRATCRSSCPVRKQFRGILVSRILKATLVGLLWAVSVLIDGDWYVCCKVGRSEQQAQIACKDKTEITDDEKEIITEAKNVSRRFGFILLLGIAIVSALMTMCNWKRWRGDCCDKRLVYEKLILEEEGRVLKEDLREAAKDHLAEIFCDKIHTENWIECLDAAAEITENPKSVKLSARHEKQIREQLQGKQEERCLHEYLEQTWRQLGEEQMQRLEQQQHQLWRWLGDEQMQRLEQHQHQLLRQLGEEQMQRLEQQQHQLWRRQEQNKQQDQAQQCEPEQVQQQEKREEKKQLYQPEQQLGNQLGQQLQQEHEPQHGQ